MFTTLQQLVTGDHKCASPRFMGSQAIKAHNTGCQQLARYLVLLLLFKKKTKKKNFLAVFRLSSSLWISVLKARATKRRIMCLKSTCTSGCKSVAATWFMHPYAELTGVKNVHHSDLFSLTLFVSAHSTFKSYCQTWNKSWDSWAGKPGVCHLLRQSLCHPAAATIKQYANVPV